MNERIEKLAEQAGATVLTTHGMEYVVDGCYVIGPARLEKFAEAIVKEMCGLMEQAEDDAYHCFEPSERPTAYIEWLRNWQERFEKHFGVEE
jgi:hypothetical protein